MLTNFWSEFVNVKKFSYIGHLTDMDTWSVASAYGSMSLSGLHKNTSGQVVWVSICDGKIIIVAMG